MTSRQTNIFIGKPRFIDDDLERIAATQGQMAAWLNAYSRYGSDVPNHVTGDFAVAFNTPSGGVFMAVDRFAVRSLCYRQTVSGLVFGERADKLADESSEIHPQAIFDYLYFHVIPSPRTIFKGIYRLPPAHIAVFENGTLTVKSYWVPKFTEPSRPSFNRLRNEFRELLQAAVKSSLDGAKPGCFLSGGTDSSTVAGMIGMAAGKAASTYSIGFEAEGYDEMAFARIAARHFNTDHHEYYVTPEDLVRSIPAVAQHYDQPFGNSSALPAYYCAKMAKEDGVTSILAGDGGDELFGGNSRYAKQKLFSLYAQVPKLLRHGLLEPVLLNTPLGSLPLARKGGSYIRQAKIPLPARSQSYNLLYKLGIQNIFHTDFLNQVDLSDPDRQQESVWAESITDSQTNRELAFDWRYTLAECDLPKVVGTTGLAGIDVAFPMLDQRLVDFSLCLPVDFKLKGLKLRWFFKEALRGFLPDEILAKKKQGFGLPFGFWAARNDSLRKLAEESVRGLVDRRLVRGDFVDALFSRLLYEHPGYYGEMIWIGMMLEQWLRGRTRR